MKEAFRALGPLLVAASAFSLASGCQKESRAEMPQPLAPACVAFEKAPAAAPDELTCPAQFTLRAGPSVELGPGARGAQLLAADVNGDGQEDVLVLRDGELAVWTVGAPPRRQALPRLVAPEPGYERVALLADVDADGALDLLVQQGDATPWLWVLRNDGQGGFEEPRVSALAQWQRLATAGDVSGGAGADVILTDSAGGLSLLTSRDDGSFEPERPLGLPPFATATVGQLDGLGKSDLVTDAFYALAKPEGGFALGASEFGGPANLSFVDDLNGDGHLDVLLWASAVGSGERFLGDGAGHFGPREQLPRAGDSPEYSWSERVRDIDCDGQADLLYIKDTLRYAASREGATTASGYLGHRQGAACVPFHFQVEEQTVPADVNRDGNVDLAVLRVGPDPNQPVHRVETYLRGAPSD